MQCNITYIQGSESDDVYLVHLCVTFSVRSLSHVQWCEGDRQGRYDILVERGIWSVKVQRDEEDSGRLLVKLRYVL